MEKIFLFCAILGSVFVVLQFVALMLGFGGDDVADDAGNGDVAIDTTDDGGSGASFLRAFSLRALTAGVAFFGLGGIASQKLGTTPIVALSIAVVSGIVAFIAVFYLMKALSSFNRDNSLRMESAVGASGTVYLTIPAKRKDVGKVTIVQQERSIEYDAQSDAESPLTTGTPIVVVEVLSPSLLLVAPK